MYTTNIASTALSAAPTAASGNGGMGGGTGTHTPIAASGNGNTNDESYVYHTATGDVPIKVSKQWRDLLREMDREDNNNERKHHRHRGYSGFYDADAGLYEDDPQYSDVFDKRAFCADELDLEDRDLVEATRHWVHETLANKPRWADMVKQICINGVSRKEYAAAHNMSAANVSQQLSRARAKLREARANGTNCPI